MTANSETPDSLALERAYYLPPPNSFSQMHWRKHADPLGLQAMLNQALDFAGHADIIGLLELPQGKHRPAPPLRVTPKETGPGFIKR